MRQMKSRNILIEKYIEPSEIEPETGEYFGIESWFDRNRDLHSNLGQPDYVYYNNEQVYRQHWHKKGLYHREKGLPAVIFYDKEGKIERKEWYKHGEFIKEEKY